MIIEKKLNSRNSLVQEIHPKLKIPRDRQSKILKCRIPDLPSSDFPTEEIVEAYLTHALDIGIQNHYLADISASNKEF